MKNVSVEGHRIFTARNIVETLMAGEVQIIINSEPSMLAPAPAQARDLPQTRRHSEKVLKATQVK